MRSKTSSSLSLSDFSRILSGLAVSTTVACAGSVTPPETTPVYADEVAPGMEPVEVERQSINRPEPETVSEQSVESDDVEAEEAEEATDASEKSETVTDEADGKKVEEKPPEEAKPTPKPEPVKKTVPKKKVSSKKSSDSEGGCGAGTCG